MVGGGSFGWEPGEWTDDTSMAIAIAEVAATGADLREEEALDALVRRWHEWSQRANDVGVQTRSVLSRAGRHGISAQTARMRIGGAARNHWPHRGQRLADADRTTGTGLPRRRSRTGGGGPFGERADALGPRGR